MQLRRFRLTPATILLLCAAGCSTAAGGNSVTTSYSTHRLVEEMDSNLTTALNRLNETTADLLARQEANDRAARQLMSVAEENQLRLDRLQRSLDSLTSTLYQHLNLSPPPSMPTVTPNFSPGAVDVESDGITVQPPSNPIGIEYPDRPPIRQTQTINPDQHYRAAQDFYASGNYQQAVEHFAEHNVRFPDSPHASNAQYWKAHCHFKMGSYDQAIEEFERLRSDFPTSTKIPTAMHNQAVAYSRKGQNARAEALFRRLIAEYPDDVATEGAREKLRRLQGLQ